jgi:hypothetical protein
MHLLVVIDSHIAHTNGQYWWLSNTGPHPFGWINSSLLVVIEFNTTTPNAEKHHIAPTGGYRIQ